MAFSVSHTTRAPRPGEVDGVHYHFTDRAGFERMVRENGFAEWAEVHGNLYGTSLAELEAKREAGRDVILDIDVQGAASLRGTLPDAVRVFIAAPSLVELRRRLTARGDAAETIERRIANAREEMARAEEYDYIVINGELERAAAELCAVVTAERCRASRRLPELGLGNDRG